VSAAKDLSTIEPCGLDSELEGYAWIPRMLDKARATAAGTAGSYMFGCPVDHTCMARLGVTPELILELASRYPDDADVLDALRAHGIPSAEQAWFDGPAVEDELQEADIYLRVRTADALPSDAGGRVFEGGQHDASVSVVVIDAGPGEREPRHTHPVEEVVVVQAGQATFTLGAWQARIIRAGEIVRIPAGVAHGWDNTGEEQLKAVAAHAAAAVVTEPAA
jgi:quercetin dioxygenase-like cupin family protein